MVALFAEELPSRYRISPAWRARVGTYRASNVIPGTPRELLARVGRLTIDRGVLEWNRAVEKPSDSGLSFSYGLGVNIARGAGVALVPAGNTLTTVGVTYRKINSG